jgi:hypothetical protein
MPQKLSVMAMTSVLKTLKLNLALKAQKVFVLTQAIIILPIVGIIVMKCVMFFVDAIFLRIRMNQSNATITEEEIVMTQTHFLYRRNGQALVANVIVLL